MSLLSLSPYSAELALTELLGAATHLALFTADPIAAGSLASEQADADGYSRQPITWTSAGGPQEETSAEIAFEASGSAWTGPWYVAAMDSGTHGAGNVIAVAVWEAGTPDEGQPWTTFDRAGISGIPDGGKLIIPIGDLIFAVGAVPDAPALDPVAEILAMQPTLFWVFDRLDAIPGTYMWQDSAKTTPVTATGQPVGCVADLVEGREFAQTTSGMRPEYAAGIGLDFDGTDDWLLAEDCSDLLAMANNGDTKTVGITVISQADDSTGQRVLFSNSQAAEQARIGVEDSNGSSQGGLFITQNGLNLIPYAEFYQVKHGVIREYQHYGTSYGNAQAITTSMTTLITFENPVIGRYGHANASQYWLGSVGCAVFFDRRLNIPELAKLQQMLLRIGV